MWATRLGVLGAAVLASGCIFGPEAATDRLHAEVARDLLPADADEAAVRARGERLLARARAAGVGDTLTLTDCLALALADSDDLRARAERVLQADARRWQALAGLLPRVTPHWKYTHDSDKIVFGGQTFQPRSRNDVWIEVVQPLLDGRLGPAVNLADALGRIEGLQLRDARDRLLFSVAGAFYQVLGAEGDVSAAGSALARAPERARVLAARQAAGLAEPHEVAQARAHAAAVAVQLAVATSDVQRSRARLGRLIGITPFTQVCADTLVVEPPAEPTAELVRRALAARADLAAARGAGDAARAERGLVLTQYLPKVDLNFTQWTLSEGGFNEKLNWTVAIDARWELFDGGAREARLAGARSREREQAWRVRALEKDVAAEVTDALLAFHALHAALDAYAARVAAAREAADATAAQLAAGTATTLDVLVTTEAFEAAERDATRAGFADKLAALRIRLAVGDLRTLLEDTR